MYFITVIEALGFEHEAKRTWGYYPDYHTAIKVLHENLTDLYEGCYGHAVVEKIGPGISARVEESQWFKWDREKHGYFETEEPYRAKYMTNWAIG